MDDIFSFWKKNVDESMQQWQQQWQQAFTSGMGDMQKWFAPWQPIIEMLKGLAKELPPGYREHFSQYYKEEINKQTFGVFEETSAKFLHNLRQMTAEKFVAEYQKWVASLAKENPKTVVDYWQAIITEYLKDMEAISSKVRGVDLQKIMKTWQELASEGKQSEHSQRFFESLRVKLKYGIEYYGDPEKIEVGVTPRKQVWEKGNFKLYHYASEKKSEAAPILMVYSLINKPYILDLLPGHSLIEYFKEQGLNVYLIDWGEPEFKDRHMSLDDLIDVEMNEIVDFVAKHAESEKVSLLGHCMGGVLGLLYTALYPEKIERFLSLTTPITSKNGGIVGVWSSKVPIDQVVDTFGNMPGKLIRYTFLAIKPYLEAMRLRSYYKGLHKMNKESERLFLAVDKWANDNIDVPGEVFRQFVNEVYQENRFCNSQTRLNGKVVDLKNIDCPLFNYVVEGDWIVPSASATILNELVSSKDKVLENISGNHLSPIIDPRARKNWDKMKQFFAGELLYQDKP